MPRRQGSYKSPQERSDIGRRATRSYWHAYWRSRRLASHRRHVRRMRVTLERDADGGWWVCCNGGRLPATDYEINLWLDLTAFASLGAKTRRLGPGRTP